MKTTNTTKNPHLDWVLGGNPRAIENQEKEGQQELVGSSQLPKRCNHPNGINAAEQYHKMGIKTFTGSKGDDLFMGVELPKGWKKEATDHSMWNNLVDDKSRIRATFFYKAAFYDRDSFINFSTRYSYRVISFLPIEEQKKYSDSYEERNNTPNYFEILDCGTVIYTTKDTPIIYTRKYTKESHRDWWTEYSQIDTDLRAQAKQYLSEKYPDWQDINAYWD